MAKRKIGVGSQKTKVIEHLFFKHWDEQSQTLQQSLMSLDDVADAIRDCNKSYGSNLSAKNPANFMKDLMRGVNASANWPEAVAKMRYTAVQRTGSGDVFEFIPYLAGQSEPFPDAFKLTDTAPRYPVQSISLPLVTKMLGRSDEAWLIQTAVNLRVVETHFAVGSALPILELSHLQMSIKLRQTEIDALFFGLMDTDEGPTHVIVTCEAKHYRDPFIPQQIVNQVQAAFGATDVQIVIPIGLKAIKNTGFYVTEFEAVKRADAAKMSDLTLASHAIYELKPPVKGI
ncbi:hypothetical protein AB4Z43_08380 [Mesorhizobium sp. 2RAF45]|uniref:hypothetical protein n=1 Tax=Mesorhizobium sp. 2RAF45 TaxID=3233001 RepID=UPI003F9E97C3